MLNLLVISPNYPDKDNNTFFSMFVKEQVNYLRPYFENITVIAPKPRTYFITKMDRVCRNYEYDNVKIIYPKYYYFPTNFFRSKIDSLHTHAVLNAIKKYKIKFDIIHAHFTSPSGVAGHIIKKETKKPLILTIHENSKWFHEELKEAKQQNIMLWREADLIIRWNDTDLLKLTTFNKNLISLPIGFDPGNLNYMDLSASKKELKIPDNTIHIVSMGALIERKGFDYLIEAMNILRKKRTNCLCSIIGSGVLKPHLKNKIKRLGLEREIRIIDPVNYYYKALWFSSADVFVMPSLSESFGLVTLEAMACGSPVVATINGGSELIVNDRNGILCNPGDSDCLADAIYRAICSNWDRRGIAKDAINYSWPEINKKLMYKIESILNI